MDWSKQLGHPAGLDAGCAIALFGVDSQSRRLRTRVVDICAGLPEVAVEDGRHIGFSVRGKRFAWFLDDHHGDGRLALTCKAPPGENTALAERHPGRFFLPSYVASRGWVGLRLDAGPVDWDEVERLAVDAYLLTAPKRLGASVRSPSPGSPGSP